MTEGWNGWKRAGVEASADVLGGQPCIAGTRIKTKCIKNFWRAGYGIQSIIKEYPTLTEEQVREALTYEGEFGN